MRNELVLRLAGVKIALNHISWWAIATPSPPNTSTVALVKLLPFATVVFCQYRRSPIQPNSLGFSAIRATFGTTKLIGMNCLISPFRRGWSKSFHAGILV